MNGVIYSLIVNVCVASLFAAVFAVISVSYHGQRGASWFSATFFVGMLMPLSELAVYYSDWPREFALASYGSFLLSVLMMSLGLSAIAGRPLPWGLAAIILAWGIAARIAIWNDPHETLSYQIVYQSSYVGGAALSLYVAVAVVRRSGGWLWWGLTCSFALIVLHLATKPLFAVYFGSGADEKAYASSAYALFSQATSGVLFVLAGLQILLIILEAAVGRKTVESETDPLTAIANRRGFDRRAALKVAEARHTGAPLAVVVFDLDYFKRINDNYGHSTGDAVIRAFADLLGTTMPPSALVARLGGEEFVVLLDRTTQLGAWRAAQAIRWALPGMGGRLPPVTVSGGIAELRPDDTLAALLNRADEWTYAAKANGRNRICPVPEPGSPPFETRP